eukprot:6491958-Amphidinium_carterae.6
MTKENQSLQRSEAAHGADIQRLGQIVFNQEPQDPQKWGQPRVSQDQEERPRGQNSKSSSLTRNGVGHGYYSD